jgi:hypothetical protein
MPQPTSGDVHVDAFLTNILVAFTQDPNNFVAGKVFPDVPVAKQSDIVLKYDRGDWNRAVAQKRAPGTPSAGGGWKTDKTDTYFADVWAVHKDVDDQVRSNQDAPISMDRDATQWVSLQLLLRKDIEWASNFFTTGIWTGSTTAGDITPGTLWDAAAGDPIFDIQEQMVSIAQKTGQKATKIVFSMDTWNAVRNNGEVLDRIKHTQRGIVTEELVAALLGLEEVLVLSAIQTTSTEGATDVMAFIGGVKDALLVYTPATPSILLPAAGYNFMWTGQAGSQDGMRVKNFRIESLSSDRIEGEMAFDPKQVSAVCGVFFSNAIS